jgi:hypothetical protein
MKVKVVSLRDDANSAEHLKEMLGSGNVGILTHEFVDGAWKVVFGDGKYREYYYDELSPANVKVLEGELQYGDGQFWVSIDGECLTSAVKEFAGKRVRITVEEI